MARVELERIHKRFGAAEVLHEINLDLGDGEFVVFVGPSGCGKTTLLRCIAGLEQTSAGVIRIDGRDVTTLAPSRRGAAMVFQSYALYPHKTVFDNMAFGLRMVRRPKTEIDARVRSAAHTLQIDRLLDRKPRALSGGQRQRVAIGRAIVREPGVFLFDEPLSNLDAALRVQMRVEIARLHREIAATMIYVTHDQVEAMTLADRIVVLRDGHVEQVGSPRELYTAPSTRFVAGFIGAPQMNFLPAMLGPAGDAAVGASVVGDATVPFTSRKGTGSGPRSVTIGIRPEAFRLDADGPVIMSGRVCHTEYLGTTLYVHVDLDRTLEPARVVVAAPPQRGTSIGEVVPLSFAAEDCHLFGDDGSAL